LLFSNTTTDHTIVQQRRAGITSDLALTGRGPGLPAAMLADVRATPGVRSAVALTPTTLGPSLGESDDIIPAQILDGGQGGGVDVGVTAGSLTALHGNAIALGRHRASADHAHVGDRVTVMLGDGTHSLATVVAIYSRDPALRGRPPRSRAGRRTPDHTTAGNHPRPDRPPRRRRRRLRTLARQYPELRVSGRASIATAAGADSDAALNRWLGPIFVVMIFAFTSIAVINTLVMIGLRRRRELALMRLAGATSRQVRSMARREAALIIAIGLGLGLVIAFTALLPLTHALNGSLHPNAPGLPLAAILGIPAVTALLALAVPTRRALRSRPAVAMGLGE
jgi:putative ABC transport system permease protein